MPALTPEATLRRHWKLGGELHRPVAGGGLINQTWSVGQPPRYALQLLHRRFGDPENTRIESVGKRLRGQGIATPRLVRTVDGGLSAAGPEGRRWRLLTWISGETHATAPSPAHAAAAAGLIARFHDALIGTPEGEALPRTDFHDTDGYMRVLESALAQTDGIAEAGEIGRVGEAILTAWQEWRAAADAPPPAARPGHGDLKISNVVFDGESGTALALIDLDTLAQYGLEEELGDALRSWCNPRGENTTETEFDAALFEAAVAGYLAQSTSVTRDERRRIVHGVGRIALQLASRFCADAVTCSYWAWDAAVAPTQRAHNLLRAEGQLNLARQVAARRAELERLVARV